MSKSIRKFIYDEFSISQEQYENGWTMPYPHYHNDYEIYLLESGLRIIKNDGNDYVTRAFDAALFSPNIAHCSRGDSPFSGICIHFSQNYLNRHLTAPSRELLLECFNAPVISLSADAVSQIKNYADSFVISAPDNFVILTYILHTLTTELKKNAHIPTPFKTEANTKAEKIFSYVDTNYTSIQTIAQLAESFDASEGYIFKIFHTKYGQTPKAYINELRINHACHRLKNTDTTVLSIATDCGFECYEYFIRLFKKIKKCTPTEYRKNVRK